MDTGVDEPAGLPSKRKVPETKSPPPLGAPDSVLAPSSPPLDASGSVLADAPRPQPDFGSSTRRSVRRRVPSTRQAESSLSDPSHGPSTTASAPRRSQSCPPAPALAPPTAKKARRPGKLPACGKNVCGDTTGWADPCHACDNNPSHTGRLLCSACHLEPLVSSANKAVWNHLTSEGDIACAESLWLAHVAKTPQMETVVKPTFVPTAKCLCSRPACFHATFRRLEKAAQRETAVKCVACGTTKSTLWRTPSSELGLFQRRLSSGPSRGNCVKEGRVTLESGSTICNPCGLQFRDKGKEWVQTNGPGYTVSSFLLYLLQTPPSPKLYELSVSQTQQAVLEVLGNGRPVPLEDGMAMLTKARGAVGLNKVALSRTQKITRLIFDHLSDTVADAQYAIFDGGQVGEDNRSTVQYMMPTVLDPLYVANLHRGLKRCEGEVKRLTEQSRSGEEAETGEAHEVDKVSEVGRRKEG